MSADATCRTCPHFRVTGKKDTLRMRCAAHPPVFVQEPSHRNYDAPTDPYVKVRWPEVDPGDFCGEHPLRQRDRLAAMAMQGLAADGHVLKYGPRDTAERAYEIADAMLAERLALKPQVEGDAGP